MSEHAPRPDLRRHFEATPLGDFMGAEVVHCEPGYAKLRMVAQPRHLQAMGFVHGGVLAALADTVLFFALLPSLKPGESAVTVELKVNYLSGVKQGEAMVAESRLVQRGRRLAVGNIDIFEESTRRPLLTGLGTYMINQARTPRD